MAARAGEIRLPSARLALPSPGRYPLRADERASGSGNPSCRTQPRTQAAAGPGAKFGQSGLPGQVGAARAVVSPLTGRAQGRPWPGTARGLWAGLSPTLPRSWRSQSMVGCEPTWLGDTSPCLRGTWTIGLLLVTLSEVVQVAHVTRLHAHEARETLHIIVPGGGGGSEVRGRGWGQRLQTKAKGGGWALTWHGPRAAEPPRE